MKSKTCVLTIAGSDPGAGAGIQSDLKTFKNHGVYGLSVITAITAQNTKGVTSSYAIKSAVITAQLNSVFEDFRIRAVKTGMLANDKVVEAVAHALKKRKNLKLVIDPVIHSKNSFRMLSRPGIRAMKKSLLRMAYLVTPNIPETEALTGMNIESLDDLETAAVMLHELGAKNVLIKGGHLKSHMGLPKGTDILFDGRYFHMFSSNYVNTKNTHGIGCTLSAAIVSNLAMGKTLIKSIEASKQYVVRSLKKSVKIGKGFSPVEQ